ncbi:MAG: bifunctional glutamate N-acetyltransferase/amino-acid acetyltransferase ArgJ [Thermoanaerobaculia bacterium]|nr:bifunctional glutamate N-acetyltransferase/amino-acid acetyltransferase ArgJ [Thermoanaerobaculia bacterium]
MDIPETPLGFRFGSAASNMRFRDRDDVALITCEPSAVWAGMFTTSTAAGAPVLLARDRLAAGGPVRAVLVNAGIANAGTGRRGIRDAREVADLTARELGAEVDEVLCASTGWIGERLDLDCLREVMPELVADLSPEGPDRAARAIMTSDSVPKLAGATCRIDGRRVRLLGFAKGSGMVSPSMATLLAFLLTDAACDRRFLQVALEETVAESFNALSIDGEMSTSDMVLLLASGAAETGALSRRHPDAGEFRRALRELALNLTRQLARDGEGATKQVTVTVREAEDRSEARRAVDALIRSFLLRTAVAGSSPAWSRIVSILGAARIPFEVEDLNVRFGETDLVVGGTHQGAAAEAAVREHLAGEEVHLVVSLARGTGTFSGYTCDLTPASCEENMNPPLPPPE